LLTDFGVEQPAKMTTVNAKVSEQRMEDKKFVFIGVNLKFLPRQPMGCFTAITAWDKNLMRIFPGAENYCEKQHMPLLRSLNIIGTVIYKHGAPLELKECAFSSSSGTPCL